MIDYIYLILILILIGFIIFIIYLSYEYRVKEGFDVNPSLRTSLNTNLNLDNLQSQGEIFDNNYKDYISDAISIQASKDNIKQVEILQNANQNLLNSKKIIDLQDQLYNNAPKFKNFPIDKLISTIKSKYNSQYISTFANDIASYGILVNDKCLTVNGLCKEDYCLLDCQNNLYSSDSQKFITKRINSDVDAAVAMNVPITNISSGNTDSSGNSIYPYNIFTSVVNNHCLASNDGGITVEKCNLNNIKQQWAISPDENICVLK